MARFTPRTTEREMLGVLLSPPAPSPALDVRLLTALQVLQVLQVPPEPYTNPSHDTGHLKSLLWWRRAVLPALP